ncbi:MAG: translation initiation factor IF-2 [Candidatus Odinarchaeia archaeon]
MPIRQPIVTVLGHIDTGKTTLLDKIRGTTVQLREAGGITQHVGASFFPTKVLEEVCGPLLKRFNVKLTIPGLLIVDSPGHAVFMNLRKRAGSVCDIAILVVDITAGFQPQTYESIRILKERKTPFIVAANKIDRIPGWRSKQDACFLDQYPNQDEHVKKTLDAKIYEIVGELSELGFQSERFDRVSDFTKTVAIVPTSAKTGEGVPELLMVLAGLTQQYMKDKLEVTSDRGRGVILEVKEEPGLGITADTILYDGILRKGDTIVVATLLGPIVTKVKALLLPKPLDEIRDPRERFDPVNEVWAAAGVKIAAQNFENIIAGAPLIVARNEEEIESAKKEILSEIGKIRIHTEKSGIVLKADTLGSLEAIVQYFRDSNIPIRLADIGDVSKKDVIEAAIVKEKEPLHAAILAFNVKILPDAKEEASNLGIPIFREEIVYRLFERYDEWVNEQREAQRKAAMSALTRPGKFKILPGYVFRHSKPAIVGVAVLGGQITTKVDLINENGEKVGTILQIQDKGENVQRAIKGQSVAVSIKGPIVGRQINENDILYVDVPESQVKLLYKKFREYLTDDELEVLDELIAIKRKTTPYWAA